MAESGPSCSGTPARASPCLPPAPVSITHSQGQAGAAMAAVLIWISLLVGKLGVFFRGEAQVEGVRSSSGKGSVIGVRQGPEGLWGINSTVCGALGNWGWELRSGGGWEL